MDFIRLQRHFEDIKQKIVIGLNHEDELAKEAEDIEKQLQYRELLEWMGQAVRFARGFPKVAMKNVVTQVLTAIDVAYSPLEVHPPSGMIGDAGTQFAAVTHSSSR